MHTNVFAKCVLVASLALTVRVSQAHDIPVHWAITMHAAEAADTSSGAYKAFVETIATDLPSAGLNGVTNTLVDGGGFEDNIDVEGDGGGKRSMNHFYDPLTHLGLSNIPPDDRIAPLGRNSFAWASTRNCPGVDFRGLLGLGANLATFNKWSWQNARDYEWDGLTLPDSTSRHDALTNMFRAVGQVMHLLEDTTQPQHARNEQHLDQFWKGRDTPWRSAIEDYGKARLDSLSFTHAMLDWKVAGFSKLEDFWDRRLYNGSATVLRDAENAAGPVLGLAEWSNGNFLGARHLFPEYSTIGKVDYYPFPSRTTSTDYNGVKSDPLLGIDDLDPEDGQGKGIYLRKNSDGVEMRHLARVNYLGAKVPGLSGKPYCTTRDANVLRDYHAALIPKAVAYSAAVIDYYFRGRIQANASPGSSANRVALMIQNVSPYNH